MRHHEASKPKTGFYLISLAPPFPQTHGFTNRVDTVFRWLTAWYIACLWYCRSFRWISSDTQLSHPSTGYYFRKISSCGGYTAFGCFVAGGGRADSIARGNCVWEAWWMTHLCYVHGTCACLDTAFTCFDLFGNLWLIFAKRFSDLRQI